MRFKRCSVGGIVRFAYLHPHFSMYAMICLIVSFCFEFRSTVNVPMIAVLMIRLSSQTSYPYQPIKRWFSSIPLMAAPCPDILCRTQIVPAPAHPMWPPSQAASSSKFIAVFSVNASKLFVVCHASRCLRHR